MKQLEPISEVLKILAESYPNISKELTKRLPHKLSDSRERKLRKVELLMIHHKSIFLEIANIIYEVSPESVNPIGFSSKSLFTSVQKLIKGEREAGSYGSKYDFGQGEVE